MMHDVVYILKENTATAELIYSLRSVSKNFPHRKIWFVGDQPEGLYPDGRLKHKQDGKNKWYRVCSSLQKITECGDITDDFYLFNDDFFVMQPQTEPFINFVDGTLDGKIDALHKNCGYSRYSENLKRAKSILLLNGCDTMNFALHLPLQINKGLLRETLDKYKLPMFRSIYGNVNHIPYIYHKDVKIWDEYTVPEINADYLSTTADSFNKGAVGRFIRDRFPEPCEYEIPLEDRIRKQLSERYSEDGDDF